jgi:hypothetical protein
VSDVSERVAHLNDLARQAMGLAPNSTVLHTRGVMALPVETINAIRDAVRDFNAFTPGDDPYGERDFGSVVVDGRKIYWKIDYYDANLEFAAPDPTDPRATNRVLTIMLAEEY